MKIIIHRSVAIMAMLCIATFFLSTIWVELSGAEESIAMIKCFIVMPGLLILIPSIVVAGASGFLLSKGRSSGFIVRKKQRMPFIAANGIFILIPAAIFLDQAAASAHFDTTFYIVQSIELLAGATNLLLMSLNMRDGLKMSGKLRSHVA